MFLPIVLHFGLSPQVLAVKADFYVTLVLSAPVVVVCHLIFHACWSSDLIFAVVPQFGVVPPYFVLKFDYSRVLWVVLGVTVNHCY